MAFGCPTGLEENEFKCQAAVLHSMLRAKNTGKIFTAQVLPTEIEEQSSLSLIEFNLGRRARCVKENTHCHVVFNKAETDYFTSRTELHATTRDS